jgi:hypothetical protein
MFYSFFSIPRSRSSGKILYIKLSQLQKSSKNGIASSRKHGIRNDHSTQSISINLTLAIGSIDYRHFFKKKAYINIYEAGFL